MTFFSTSDRLEIGGVPFISHGAKPNRFEALEYYRRVAESYNLNLKLYDKVEIITRNQEGLFDVKTSKGNFQGRNIILATGFYDRPYLIGVEGEGLPKVRHFLAIVLLRLYFQ